MQHVLYIVFLKKRVLRTDKTLCTFFFEKKVHKKAIREESRNPLKSSRRRLSAASALPEQRRKCSSNLKVFLIVRSFCACGDGEKARKFAFLEKKTSNVGDGSLCTSWRAMLGLLRKPANPVPPDCLLRFIKQADLVETEREKYTKRSGKPLL